MIYIQNGYTREEKNISLDYFDEEEHERELPPFDILCLFSRGHRRDAMCYIQKRKDLKDFIVALAPLTVGGDNDAYCYIKWLYNMIDSCNRVIIYEHGQLRSTNGNFIAAYCEHCYQPWERVMITTQLNVQPIISYTYGRYFKENG